MSGEHYLELRNFATGSRLGILTGATGSDDDAQNGFLHLAIRRRVNAPGALQVVLPGGHPLAATLPDKTLIIDWRRDPTRNIDWYRHFVSIARDTEYTSQRGQRRWMITAPGVMDLLNWYHVLWPAGTVNRTTFTAAKAETIMKTLTQYNATSSATAAAGRDRTAPLYGITLEADSGRGNTIDWTASRAKTLIDELQEIARIGGGDFDLVYTGPTTRELRFYPGQRGTDKTTIITFAENLGNMDAIQFARRRSQERTAAIVGGAGEGDAREWVARTGVNYSSTNDLELFIDARDIASGATAALQARGDAQLDTVAARDTFGFAVVQTEGTFYGPSGAGSYDLGDLVSARRPDGTTVPQQVYGVDLTWDAEREVVAVEMRTT